MSPSHFDDIFVHLRQKARLKPELSTKFLSTLGPNPTRKARPDLQLWDGHANRLIRNILGPIKDKNFVIKLAVGFDNPISQPH